METVTWLVAVAVFVVGFALFRSIWHRFRSVDREELSGYPGSRRATGVKRTNVFVRILAWLFPWKRATGSGYLPPQRDRYDDPGMRDDEPDIPILTQPASTLSEENRMLDEPSDQQLEMNELSARLSEEEEETEPDLVPIHPEDGKESEAAEQEQGGRASDSGDGRRDTLSADDHGSSAAKEREEAYISLYVMATDNRPFSGAQLLRSMANSGLVFGEHHIFHHYRENGEDGRGVLFSVANAVKPGYFDLNSMGDLRTPGIVMFMALHDHTAPLPIFDQMLVSSEKISAELGGVIEDEAHNGMTFQTIQHYREKIRAYVLKHPL